MIHYIMPMAGRGSRFKDKGYDCPKPMVKIFDRPFFFWSTQSIVKFIDVKSLTFVVLDEHIREFHIDDEIKKFYPGANIISLPEVTEGAVITCMKGVNAIDDDVPVVFNDCDHLFKCNEFNQFCNKETENIVDGLLLTFNACEPRYSFVEKNKTGDVIRTAEKETISDEAICGCYYFRNKKTFLEASYEYLNQCSYAEFFLSGVYNVLIESGKTVRSMLTDYHIPFGTPEEYEIAKKDINYGELS